LHHQQELYTPVADHSSSSFSDRSTGALSAGLDVEVEDFLQRFNPYRADGVSADNFD
jgi:hypothetical protein